MAVIQATLSTAANAQGMHRAILAWLAQACGIPIKVVEGGCWREREQRLYDGEIQLGFICGLPYVLHADHPDPCLQLLAAPVMAAARYQGRPIYFSDVVVRADRPWRSVAQLQGVRWAYNEPNSQSGHNITQVHLARQGLTWEHFGEVRCAGSHLQALRMIADGRIDAAAIDSVVLETELRMRPDLAQALRVIETFGPSPIPPVVASRNMPDALFRLLRSRLLRMNHDPAGRAILAAARMARFAQVTDEDYDPIREMNRLVAAMPRPHLVAA
ncbi:MAG: phosphate/phosphite/phosphonate ABC transporter substrate-binding protein [Candidatus Xenobia bacterium]